MFKRYMCHMFMIAFIMQHIALEATQNRNKLSVSAIVRHGIDALGFIGGVFAIKTLVHKEYVRVKKESLLHDYERLTPQDHQEKFESDVEYIENLDDRVANMETTLSSVLQEQNDTKKSLQIFLQTITQMGDTVKSFDEQMKQISDKLNDDGEGYTGNNVQKSFFSKKDSPYTSPVTSDLEDEPNIRYHDDHNEE